MTQPNRNSTKHEEIRRLFRAVFSLGGSLFDLAFALFGLAVVIVGTIVIFRWAK